MTNANASTALLRSLDVPSDCGCQFKPHACSCDSWCDCPPLWPAPCPHVLARDHGHGCDEWGRLLAYAQPQAYQQPPLPGWLTDQAPGTPAKIEVMQRRRQQRRHLYHPFDVDIATAARRATQERVCNGRDPTSHFRLADDRENDLPEAPQADDFDATARRWLVRGSEEYQQRDAYFAAMLERHGKAAPAQSQTPQQPTPPDDPDERKAA